MQKKEHGWSIRIFQIRKQGKNRIVRRKKLRKMKQLKRCEWCGTEPLYVSYHDKEWGIPVYDDRKLFEMLCLEGAQAGLSWLTILKRREGYLAAFDQFDAEKIVQYDEEKLEALRNDKRIIRNR